MIVKAAPPFTISLANPHSSECGYSRETHKLKLRRSCASQPKKQNMKHTVRAIAVAAVLTLGAWTIVSAEEEKEQTVQMSDLPAAVQKTIKAKAGSNKIVKVEKKMEEGKTIYEADVNKKGVEWSIEVDENGKFLRQYKESEEKEEKEKGEKY
jgi:uncharacterized membrane protein YkoI